VSIQLAFQDRAMTLGVPFSLHLDLTYRCNERCVHCYLDHNDRGEMTTAEIKRVLSEAAETGTFYLTLSGGEPMLRKDFVEILAHAHSLTFATKIKTNATLVTKKMADFLREYGVYEVQISVYSHRAEVHDGITKLPGSFDRSIRAIKMMTNAGLKVVIATPLMRANITDYPSVQVLAGELGIPFTFDPTITPMMDGNQGVLEHRLESSDLHSIFRDPSLVGDVAEFCKPPAPTDADLLESLPCSAGHTSVYVSPYGELFPCVQFPVSCGNVRTQHFRDIWQHSSKLEEIRSIRLKDLSCSGCELLSGCTRCPGLAYMEGDMRGPSSADCTKSMAKLEGAPNTGAQLPKLSGFVRLSEISFSQRS
jgi:AdoMet-dependent heme synthase